MKEELSESNIRFLDTFVLDSLIKEKEGFLPILYYNSRRIRSDATLPETYLTTIKNVKKTSRQLELPQESKYTYYGCVVYAKPEDCNYLNEIAGYSASKTREDNDYLFFNINKINAYGELRSVDYMSLALLDRDTVDEIDCAKFKNYMLEKRHIPTHFIPVTRLVNGKPHNFWEVNFDMSFYYYSFDKNTRNKLIQNLYKTLLSEFIDYDALTLLSVDGKDYFADDKNIQAVTNKMKLNNLSAYNKQLIRYFATKNIVDKSSLYETIESAKIAAKGEERFDKNIYNKLKVTKIDDANYRTMLQYIDMRKNKQSIDIFNVIKQYFKDSKINTAEIIQGGVPFVATGVAVSRQNELEFARVLPFLNKYWQTLGVLDNVKKLKYLNYYGEYYDCSRTPFALLKGQDKTYDIEQLASELNERYNYDIKSQPIERVINGERQKVAELSLDWYANRDFENGFLSSFDKTIPILKNIEFIAACSCDNNDIKYYPIYPNGQLK